MKKICFFIMCFLLVIPFVSLSAEEIIDDKNEIVNENNEDDSLLKYGKSGILIEAKTGEILYEKNSHDRYAPASMTKIMSMILIMEQIEKGNLKWNEILVTSEYASSMGGSQIFLQPNEKMSVEDLFKAVSIGSANDATVVFAERIAGTEDNFVKKMNEKAKELGLKDTNFKNSTGLDEANHYSSAYDMAFMARELVKHEQIFKYTTIYEDYLRENTDNKFWLVNTNKLVRFYEGADGLKTGHTDDARYCLAATAKRNGLRLIGIVLGVPSGQVRNTQTMNLLDYGFNNVKLDILIKKGTVVKRIKLDKASIKNIDIILKDDLTVVESMDGEEHKYTYDVSISNIKLPINVFDKVGTIKVLENDKVISTGDLVVNTDIKKLSYFDLLFKSLLDIFSGEI